MLAQPTFHLQLKLTSCPAPTVREGCSSSSSSSCCPLLSLSLSRELLKAKPELGNSLAAGAAAVAAQSVEAAVHVYLSVYLVLCYNKFLHLPQCGATSSTFLNWFPTKLTPTPTPARSINIYRRRFSVEHFHFSLSLAAV